MGALVRPANDDNDAHFSARFHPLILLGLLMIMIARSLALLVVILLTRKLLKRTALLGQTLKQPSKSWDTSSVAHLWL